MINTPSTQDLLLAAAVAEQARQLLRAKMPKDITPEAKQAWARANAQPLIEEAFNELLFVSSVISRLQGQATETHAPARPAPPPAAP